jgi:hypothetical protein
MAFALAVRKRPSRNEGRKSSVGIDLRKTTNRRISMTKTVHGKVSGRTIELDEDPWHRQPKGPKNTHGRPKPPRHFPTLLEAISRFPSTQR